MRQVDTLVLGGGPAGSTAANLLAQGGQKVALLEKSSFPRFHIGESLLPATVPLFQRLGVYEAVRASSVHKPGGKWFYGKSPVLGRFSEPCKKASFLDTPYSYMVERSVFDKIMLDAAATAGADVREGIEATALLREGDRVTGVKTRDPEGNEDEIRARWILDATGARSLVAAELGIRERSKPQRMAVYATFRAEALDPHLKDGWFVGEQLYDGWVWTIPQPGERMSIGVVLSVDEFRRTGASPEQLLEYWLKQNRHLREGLAHVERESEVRVTGSMGHSAQRLSGDGWTLLGDAAYFVDPCWSSGVHLAVCSAQRAADVLLERGDAIAAEDLAEYETVMKQHEFQVTRMVNAFYMASRNPWVQRFVAAAQNNRTRRLGTTFIGGDFTQNSGFVSRWYGASWLIDTLTGWAYPPPDSGLSTPDASRKRPTASR